MYAMIRTFENPELADALAARSDEVESLIRRVDGLRSYHLIRTDAGVSSLTVCDDKASAEASVQMVMEFFQSHPELPQVKPQVTGGEVIVQLGAVAAV
ncbi:MAG: hypothetical protein QOF68_740 [Gaiellales bacterium]|jgi:hypothetical protein|nr:hypothetical protein [Gaiellales bacterium]